MQKQFDSEDLLSNTWIVSQLVEATGVNRRMSESSKRRNRIKTSIHIHTKPTDIVHDLNIYIHEDKKN